jgi:hypothetical protein
MAQILLARLGEYHCGRRNCVLKPSDNVDDVRDFLDARKRRHGAPVN